MTCIVGLVHEGRVHIGGDRAGVDGRLDMMVQAQPKVFLKDGIAFGYTTSFRMGQRLQHVLSIPKRHPDDDLMKWVVSDLVNAIREDLKAAGWLQKDREQDVAGTFLVGVAGRLFQITDELAVLEPATGYAACGCGDAYALGSLHTSATEIGSTCDCGPQHRVRQALDAAAAHNAGVHGPFDFIATGGTK